MSAARCGKLRPHASQISRGADAIVRRVAAGGGVVFVGGASEPRTTGTRPEPRLGSACGRLPPVEPMPTATARSTTRRFGSIDGFPAVRRFGGVARAGGGGGRVPQRCDSANLCFRHTSARHALHLYAFTATSFSLHPGTGHRGVIAGCFEGSHRGDAACLSKVTWMSSPGTCFTLAPQSGHTTHVTEAVAAEAAHPWLARCSRQKVRPQSLHSNGKKSSWPHPAFGEARTGEGGANDARQASRWMRGRDLGREGPAGVDGGADARVPAGAPSLTRVRAVFAELRDLHRARGPGGADGAGDDREARVAKRSARVVVDSRVVVVVVAGLFPSRRTKFSIVPC